MEKKKSGWWSEIKGLLWAVLLALVIRSVGFEPYNIPSSSMVPTLLVGDYLFITKYDYGYSRHSFPFSLPIIPSGRIFEKAPERGDIVVFKVPTDNRTDYIKRVIGLPGDKVQVSNGRLFINGEIVPREKIAEEDWTIEKEGLVHYTKYEETLPNGVKHFIYERSDDAGASESPKRKIPQSQEAQAHQGADSCQSTRDFPLRNAAKLRFVYHARGRSQAGGIHL